MLTQITNRLVELDDYYGTRPHPRRAPADLSRFSATKTIADRVLVVLIQNGGVDLGLPDLVNRLIDEIPGAAALIGDDLKAQIVTSLRDWLRKTTDQALESAELALDRYTAAKPDTYGDVVV